ncbi:MAG: peptidoglycan DD-metalloendopeptidase family protein [Paludibacteraceae bacterium]|nr:peptidoglycan DD-metalloendopeptidase family protein [Paludibacteraceae bacterium]
MKHILYILLLCVPVLGVAQSVKDLQQEQQKIQQQIKETDRMLSQTKSDKKNTQNKLNILNQDIKNRKKMISSINTEIDVLNKDIETLNTRKQTLQTELEQHQADYAHLVRATHYAQMQASPLLFLLSAKSFQQLIRRMRYMHEFQQYRKQAVRRIQGVQTDIDIQNNLLSERKQDRNIALEKQKSERDKLAQSERKQQAMLKELKKKESNLSAQLKKQQQKANEINRKIEEMIQKQTRNQSTLTKEQQLIAGGFERNKGLLPWPVAKGFISGFFGTHQHPVYEHVTINNKGIYLQTETNASARAVYEGEVSGVLVLGNTYAVIVQHGNYRTVYSNLVDLKVKQGDKVVAKQAIGRIYTDADNDNKTEVFFQIYKDRTLLDPTPWLAQ